MKIKNVVIGLLLVLGGVVGGFGCASRYTPIVRFPTNAAGFTNCDQHNNPVVGIAGQVPIQEVYFIRLHEEEHVRQIQKSKMGCRDFMERLAADANFRLQMEAEAYCVDLEARALAGYVRQPMVDSLAVHIQRNLANLLPLEEVKRRMPCGGSPPPIKADGVAVRPK